MVGAWQTVITDKCKTLSVCIQVTCHVKYIKHQKIIKKLYWSNVWCRCQYDTTGLWCLLCKF